MWAPACSLAILKGKVVLTHSLLLKFELEGSEKLEVVSKKNIEERNNLLLWRFI